MDGYIDVHEVRFTLPRSRKDRIYIARFTGRPDLHCQVYGKCSVYGTIRSALSAGDRLSSDIVNNGYAIVYNQRNLRFLFVRWSVTVQQRFGHRSAIVQPSFSHSSATVQPSFRHSSATVQPLFSYRSATFQTFSAIVQPLFSHIRAIVQPLFSHRSVIVEPSFSHFSAT